MLDTIQFDLSLQNTDPNIAIGDTLAVYYSDDGVTWQATAFTCVVDTQTLCNFSSPQLGLFALGTISTNVPPGNTDNNFTGNNSTGSSS